MNKSAAFSEREKVLLAHLVRDSYGVVENKRTDGASLAVKKNAWKAIGAAYNAQPEVALPRTAEQLRRLWTNLKQRKRKETTAVRHHMLATDGGPPTVLEEDPVMQIMELASPNIDVAVSCAWDSTTALETGKAAEVHVEDVGIPTTPVFAAPSRASIWKNVANIAAEKNIRMEKTLEGKQQQAELHNIRMEMAMNERQHQQKVAEMELERANMELQRASMELQRASDEAQLAALRLHRFRESPAADS